MPIRLPILLRADPLMTIETDIAYTVVANAENRSRESNTLGFDPCPSILAMSPDGLSIPLTPFQKLLLKLVGISHGRSCNQLTGDLKSELDAHLGQDNQQRQPQKIWLPPGTSINRSNDTLKIEFAVPITLVLLVAGRRSGKTTIASILMSWLARRILKCSSFLDDIPILPSSPVYLLNVACDTQQAGILFEMLKENMRALDLIGTRTKSSDKFQTGRLRVLSLSSSARSARGRTACGVCFDEFAHFTRTGGPLSDVEMWKALMPSLATFGRKGLGIVATTPSGRSGVVWDLFTQRGNREGMLTVQTPTWAMNPKVSREILDEEFARDEYLARQEYGAEFLAPHGSFIEREAVKACVGTTEQPRPGMIQRHIHVDVGLTNDATAIAMGYLSKDKLGGRRIVVEHLEIHQGEKDNPVKSSLIENRLTELAGSYRVGAITFDQHQSTYLVERLKSAGLNASVIHASRKVNWEAYKYLKDLIVSKNIILPDNERLIDELSSLECDPTYDYPIVEAPSGKHDDCADAVAMCAWCLGMEKSSGWEDILNIVEGI